MSSMLYNFNLEDIVRHLWSDCGEGEKVENEKYLVC